LIQQADWNGLWASRSQVCRQEINEHAHPSGDIGAADEHRMDLPHIAAIEALEEWHQPARGATAR